MDHQQFFKEGKWLPSFAIFGNRQILTYHSPLQLDQTSSIKHIQLNPTYPAQKYLAQKIVKEAYELASNIKIQPKSTYSLEIYYFQNMMQHTVRAGDHFMESYHNIIYLTFKYLSFLASRQAHLYSVSIQDNVSIESWLTDIHSIYFQSNLVEIDDMNDEEQLLYFMKRGQYEHILSKLRNLYCELSQQDNDKKQKIDFLIQLFLIKVHQRQLGTFNLKIHDDIQQKSHLPLQKMKDRYNKFIKKLKKNDVYLTLMKIIFGDKDQIIKISNKSWPLVVLNLLLFTNRNAKNIKQYVEKEFIKNNQIGQASTKQTQYLLLLLEGGNNHYIYQKLFQVVPPFYAHLFAYFFNIVRPFPVPTIFSEDYYMDINRNILEQASQISFECLIFLYATFDIQQYGVHQGLGQMFENLLFHHVHIIDYEDKQQINAFIQKVIILSMFKLQRYAYQQLNIALNNQLEQGRVNREVMLMYACCKMLFSNIYNYQKLLKYWLQQKFLTAKSDINLITEYQNLQKEYQSSKHKTIHKELKELKALLKKFYFLQNIHKQDKFQLKIQLINQLMQITYRSFSFLQILYQFIKEQKLMLKNYSEDRCKLFKNFQSQVEGFILGYPNKEANQDQHILMEKILELMRQ